MAWPEKRDKSKQLTDRENRKKKTLKENVSFLLAFLQLSSTAEQREPVESRKDEIYTSPGVLEQ